MEERSVGAQLAAETLGTFLLVFLGNAAVTVAVTTQAFDLLGLSAMWGLGAILGIYAVGSISGAHLNPAVTLAMAVARGFPWNRVMPFVFAQLTGAVLAAIAIQVLYAPLISSFERIRGLSRGNAGSEASAMVHATFGPNPMSQVTGFGHANWFSVEMVATGLFVLAILFLTDQKNRNRPPAHLIPLMIGTALGSMVAATAPLTMAALNPARDLGPRIVAYFAGWGRVAIPGADGGFWIPIAAPLVGGLLAAVLYAGLIQRLYTPAAPAPPPEAM
jgi:glycerol uptake facilitator protein